MKEVFQAFINIKEPVQPVQPDPCYTIYNHTCHKLWIKICEIRQTFKGDLIKFCEIFLNITFELPNI